MINVSTQAASKINELLAEEGKTGSGLRVFVQGGGCSGFQYGLMIEENGGAGDQVYESNGIRLFVDRSAFAPPRPRLRQWLLSKPLARAVAGAPYASSFGRSPHSLRKRAKPSRLRR